jgi:hypothetical protein
LDCGSKGRGFESRLSPSKFRHARRGETETPHVLFCEARFGPSAKHWGVERRSLDEVGLIIDDLM